MLSLNEIRVKNTDTYASLLESTIDAVFPTWNERGTSVTSADERSEREAEQNNRVFANTSFFSLRRRYRTLDSWSENPPSAKSYVLSTLLGEASRFDNDTPAVLKRDTEAVREGATNDGFISQDAHNGCKCPYVSKVRNFDPAKEGRSKHRTPISQRSAHITVRRAPIGN